MLLLSINVILCFLHNSCIRLLYILLLERLRYPGYGIRVRVAPILILIFTRIPVIRKTLLSFNTF